jgi:hypothetical protein
MKALVFFSDLRRSALAFVGLCSCACGSDFNVGSDVLWSADHETGDLTEWYAPGRCTPSCTIPAAPGGLFADLAGVVVEGEAHSGRYALRLTDQETSDMNGPGVFRELITPPDAYYSAWYYVPRIYQTKSQWTIQKFKSRVDSDTISHGHDLNLRTLPGGQMILYVFSHDADYLQAPLADPPAFVPIETWFQIEALYRPRTDETGELLVWLDDRLVYDLENRRTAGSNDVLWSPCDIAEDIEPFGQVDEPDGAGGAGGADGAAGAAGEAGATTTGARISPEIYVDDAVISLKRVTRKGIFRP